MDLVRLAFLLIYTFGAVAFAALFLVTAKGAETESRTSRRSGSWLGAPSKPDSGPVGNWKSFWEWKTADLLGVLTSLICTFWFLFNVAITVQELCRGQQISVMYVFLMAVALIFPPIVLHRIYADEKPYIPQSRAFRMISAGIYGMYAVSGVLIVFCLAMGFRWVKTGGSSLIVFGMVSLFILFVAVSFLSAGLGSLSSRPKRSRNEEKRRLSTNLLIAASSLIFLTVLLAVRGTVPYGTVIGLGSRALPLAFIFVGTYYRSRYKFFDIFVKQGIFFLATLFLLTAFFALLPPIIEASRLGDAKPWAYALLMLPLTLALPWAYRNLGAWLDRVWLGRQFTTVDAVKTFLNGVKSATSEEDLVSRAENCLSEIMTARVEIALGECPETRVDERLSPESDRPGCCRPELALEIPMRCEDGVFGWIGLGTRANDAPYFSEDIKLVSSLSDVFFSVLANIRLQARKQEQEKREQELILNASRSELKALRAQINPHFLFNALNAIAGLIEKQPAKAEETVERLAEVFRYTLRRSESEWVRLGDEMDFIQAYLEIEQARFGERLHVSIEVAQEVADARIPAMIVQTLVENAIKHGVASIRGPGFVEIRAFRSDSGLVIEILDNGPGFEETDPLQTAQSEKSTGYGLRNVRERLDGYFEQGASLDLGREGNMTVVRIQIPISPAAGAVTRR